MSDLPSDANDRRASLTRDVMAQTGIDEAVIGRLVRTFYQEIRADAVLGPIFNARVANWDDHIEKLCAFWSSVALMSGRYHGQPMRAHVALPVQRLHFDRWLAMFERTAIETCGPRAAAHFITRARRIADSLELGIAAAHGRIVAPRHA
jgi:hemoglobin